MQSLRYILNIFIQALIAYSIGLMGLILVKVFGPGFYANQDIKTPVKIAIFVLFCTFLDKFLADELAVEGVVCLTSSLEGSGILDFDCTFLGKGGVHDVEGKENGGRGWVSHGDNRGAVKVFGRGKVEDIG